MRTLHGTLVLVLLAGAGRPTHAQDFASAWKDVPDRTWVGPDFWANRLQDWRVAQGRLECVEARPRLPLRTLHLLTRSVRPEPGSFRLTVTLGSVERDLSLHADAFAGFLIGTGGRQVDHRLSAQVHQRPAADGGLLAVVDGAGQVALRDASRGLGGGGTWSIAGPLRPGEAPLLEPVARRGEGFGKGGSRPVQLTLSATATEHGTTLVLTAQDAHSGFLLSTLRVEDLATERVDGALALVSHRGPRGARSGFWFSNWSVSGNRVESHPERSLGPVLSAMHTVSAGVLKLTAQLMPVAPAARSGLELQARDGPGGAWRTIATADVDADAFTATFRVPGWKSGRSVPYRIRTRAPGGGRTVRYSGVVRAEPRDERPFVIAVLDCHKVYTGGLAWNHSGLWMPHAELVRAVQAQRPDLLFFAGDQIYEGDLTPAQRRPPDRARLDYLYKWYRFLWSFRELMRDVPCVCIPDDHDVYHGNLWGAGGKQAKRTKTLTAQDSGGYRMPARFVNMVHRTQTSHLPDPVDPTPVLQGISVYTTRLEYAGVSCAIIADRQWKSSPSVAVPEGRFVNGWPQAAGFDPARDADVPGAELLGKRQERFLEAWSADWSHGAWMKVVLSQTLFCNVATIPRGAKSGSVIPRIPILEKGRYLEGQAQAADGDSNGWPQSGRNRALRAIRKSFAIHLAGDQHLGSTVQYGVEAFGDAAYALCAPAIANTWPRRWWPQAAGAGRAPGAPRNTGDFLDGFGNRMTVHAVSNPWRTGVPPTALNDRAPGYGIVKLERGTRRVTFEAWPRWVDPTRPGARPYPGWPVSFSQRDCYGREPRGWLPRISVQGLERPVFQVLDHESGQVIYALRVDRGMFQPWVFSDRPHDVRVGDPDRGTWKRLDTLAPTAGAASAGERRIVFP